MTVVAPPPTTAPPPPATTTPPPPPAPAVEVDKRCWPMFGGAPARTLARPGVDLGMPGKKLWARGLKSYVEYPPSYCDGMLYVNTFKGDTWAIEAATGKVLWRRVSDAHKPSTPAIAGDNLIVSAKDGTVTALSAEERQGGVAATDERDRRVLSGRRGRDRLLRRHRRTAVRGRRRHGARPLGLRHGRPDQLEPVARPGPRLHHDLRRLDLLPPPAQRHEALEHVREAGRLPLRELLRERIDGRRAALHDRALGEDRRARRLERTRSLDGQRELPRLLDAGRRPRPHLRRRLQRRPARVPQDGRAAPLADARRRADPGRRGRRRRPRLLLDPRDGDLRGAGLGREDRLALPDREVLARDRDRARVLLHAERDPRRLPRQGRPGRSRRSGSPDDRVAAAPERRALRQRPDRRATPPSSRGRRPGRGRRGRASATSYPSSSSRSPATASKRGDAGRRHLGAPVPHADPRRLVRAAVGAPCAPSRSARRTRASPSSYSSPANEQIAPELRAPGRRRAPRSEPRGSGPGRPARRAPGRRAPPSPTGRRSPPRRADGPSPRS